MPLCTDYHSAAKPYDRHPAHGVQFYASPEVRVGRGGGCAGWGVPRAVTAWSRAALARLEG